MLVLLLTSILTLAIGQAPGEETDESFLLFCDRLCVNTLSTLTGLCLCCCCIWTFICCTRQYYQRKFTRRQRQMNLVHEILEQGSQSDGIRRRTNSSFFQSRVKAAVRDIPDNLKIPRANLKLSNDAIGQGAFGVVYKGVLQDPKIQSVQVVAVKTLKEHGTVGEITKMQEFDHLHVLTLIGVCLDAGPGISIVMPYMANGSLLDYLRRERSNVELTQVQPVKKLLLKMCHQISLGMAYLAKNLFVHRDLAARNCMLDLCGDIKVGDFGLAEDVYNKGYFRQEDIQNVKLPYKWLAIESLNDAVFNEKTDVWSYGVTMWEVFSGGRIPYPAVDPLSLVQLLREGKRLNEPQNAAFSPEISAVMFKCWIENPDDRPSFSDLSFEMDRLLASVAGYMDMKMDLIQVDEDGMSYDYVQASPDEVCDTNASVSGMITVPENLNV